MEAIREGSFWEKIDRGEKAVVVELDPPTTSDISKYMAGAKALADAGIDMLTISDSPAAVARMDSSMLATRVKGELGLTVLPHLTCRDRNGIAMKALLMGLSANGIRNVLIVTGDPMVSEVCENVKNEKYKSVFEMHSRQMAESIRSLYGKEIENPFNMFGALNVNAVNFEVELERAKKKIEAGMCGLLTQPVLTDEAVQNIRIAREKLPCKILGGIMPIVSKRNAEFMNKNISGIRVDKKIFDLYDGKNKEEANELAVSISLGYASKISDYVDGYYIMTPFMRTDIVKELICKIEG